MENAKNINRNHTMTTKIDKSDLIIYKNFTSSNTIQNIDKNK